MKRYFVSDHHLDHANIINFCGRPFDNVDQMNEALLTWHNEVVTPQDHVSFLGDVTLRRGGRVDRDWLVKEIKKYNGHKRLFLGNHDHLPIEVYLAAGFEKIYATWRDQYGVIYSHIPIHPSSMGSCVANVHGHIHNNQGGDFSPVVKVFDQNPDAEPIITVRPYINVSLEVINYRPIVFEQIMETIHERVNETREAYQRSKVALAGPTDLAQG